MMTCCLWLNGLNTRNMVFGLFFSGAACQHLDPFGLFGSHCLLALLFVKIRLDFVLGLLFRLQLL